LQARAGGGDPLLAQGDRVGHRVERAPQVADLVARDHLDLRARSPLEPPRGLGELREGQDDDPPDEADEERREGEREAERQDQEAPLPLAERVVLAGDRDVEDHAAELLAARRGDVPHDLDAIAQHLLVGLARGGHARDAASALGEQDGQGRLGPGLPDGGVDDVGALGVPVHLGLRGVPVARLERCGERAGHEVGDGDGGVLLRLDEALPGPRRRLDVHEREDDHEQRHDERRELRPERDESTGACGGHQRVQF
jgi:hypothetical protein